jgi:hypothetical protein
MYVYGYLFMVMNTSLCPVKYLSKKCCKNLEICKFKTFSSEKSIFAQSSWLFIRHIKRSNLSLAENFNTACVTFNAPGTAPDDTSATSFILRHC